MEFLRFVFSSFWIWLGFVLIIVAVGDVIVNIIAEIKKPAFQDANYVAINSNVEECENGDDDR